MLLPIFRDWISYHKALELWFHSAHHNVRGSAFLADHIHLYGDLYNSLGDTFDSIVERGIGLTKDQSLADAVSYAIGASNHLKGWSIPSGQNAEQLVLEAQRRLEEYLEYLEAMRKQMEIQGILSTGLDDMLAGMCNDIESKLYLVGQRASF